MAINALCKTCKIHQIALLDKATNDVHCAKCDNKMEINPFIKTQLSSFKQFRTTNTSNKKSHQVLCKSCNAKEQPYLKKDKLFCSACNMEILHLFESMRYAIVDFLEGQAKEERLDKKSATLTK